MSQPPKVTLEDLLHLKRAERPTPEFWDAFERELRQKQLTALVQKRRWWDGLSVWTGRRIYLPAGAAAVVAFTLVAVRYSASGPVARVENHASRIAAADPAIEWLPPTIVEPATAAPTRYEEPVAHPAPLVAAAALPRIEPAAPAGSSDEISPSARSIATNLARLEQDEPELVHAVIGSRLSAARVQPAALAQTESAAVTDSPRHYRLIARYADRTLSPEPAAPALVRERLARRLGDDPGEGIRRIGVVGDRVSLKF